MAKAKVFNNGGSQAVRLPAEFRFDVDEVDVRRDPVSGDVVLSKPGKSWDEYFIWIATLDLPSETTTDREQPLDDFRDPFASMKQAATATKRRRS